MAISPNLGAPPPSPAPGTEPPNPAPPGNNQGNQDLPKDPPPPSGELESLRAQLRTAEAARKKLEDADKARADAQLSEIDRAKKQAAEADDRAKAAEADRDQVRARSQFDRAAEKMGCLDVDLAWSAIGSLPMEDGKLVGLDKALATLAASKTYLFGAGGGSGTGEGNNSQHNGPGTKNLTEADVRRMGKANFADLRAKVRSGQVRLS